MSQRSLPEGTSKVAHFSHVLGQKTSLVARRQGLEEGVVAHKEDVLLYDRVHHAAHLVGRVVVFRVLAKDPVNCFIYRVNNLTGSSKKFHSTLLLYKLRHLEKF